MSASVRRLDEIRGAEERLVATVRGFDDSDLAHASLCEGWTRSHVLAHIALNAHSVVNLIEWALTGIEKPQYPNAEERAADIERYSTRTAAEHLGALEEAGDRFRDAVESLPSDRWDFPVRGIGGSPQPVETYLFGRLREVEVHHVDLDAGYGSSDWPDPFVREALASVPERLGPRVSAPFAIDATDLGLSFAVGDGKPVTKVRGPGHALLLWFLRGIAKHVSSDAGPLPELPSWG
ncbi:MAG: maleylpyruvate isomerase family mycothiol-dependent enzyme [Actinomycetota bacterium]